MKPIRWVPTLYFAEGLPFYTVALVAGLMMKSQGVANDVIARWTSVLGLAWAFKPLWSPLLELVPNKKALVITFEFIGAAALACAALVLHLPGWLSATFAVLAVVSIASATHDIAADGLYIASLDARQQAAYAGWQGAFFNAARLAAQGGLVSLAGRLEQADGVTAAWSTIFALLALMMAALASWHLWALPALRSASRADARALFATLADVIVDFLRKPGIGFAIVFIVLFRAGEGQVQAIGPLFLRDARSAGGLGLSTTDVGVVYGTAGTLAFLGGSVLGGYFAAWRGLKRALPWLIVAMNLPNLVYWWLASARPENLTLIAAALAVEMFGYGFGFVGVILFMMQAVAPGRYQTAHYALATGVMQLGFILFRAVSGDIQTAFGYERFFLWVLVSALPVLVLSRFVRLPGETK